MMIDGIDDVTRNVGISKYLNQLIFDFERYFFGYNRLF